jgi:N-acetylmuramoyl-L-alanine amidase
MNTTARGVRFAVAVQFLMLTATLPAAAQDATVQIKVDASQASTRLVLTHSSSVAYEVRQQGDRIEIVYATPLRAEPSELLLDDPILDRFRMVDGRRLVLETGVGFRSVETFELRNPFRLVIDLRGNRRRGDDSGPQAVERPRRGKRARDKVIVLDAGHGGVETGATGPTGLEEKDVALDLARRLKSILANDRKLTVVLTRDEDRLVGLDERTAIANHNQADLFVSIHLNAALRSDATGAESYFLSSDATDDQARTLAALENRAAGVKQEQIAAVDGEMRSVDLVLWDLAQNQYLAESSVLAENMQIHLNELTGTRDRGVRQAPFRVLMGATMPSILVEVGFISNPDEETRLRSTEYRSRVAQAMANAIYDFLADLERLSTPDFSAGSGGSRP